VSRYRDPTPEAEFVPVARLDELPPGRMLRVDVDGREVALVNCQGSVYALDNDCPHNGGPLAQGSFDPDRGRVLCPWHAWSWDVRTGRAIDPPVNYRARTHDVRVEGDAILVSRYPR
jgi:nitrite reductase/ring-hydroxylating ferredoxin subunit